VRAVEADRFPSVFFRAIRLSEAEIGRRVYEIRGPEGGTVVAEFQHAITQFRRFLPLTIFERD